MATHKSAEKRYRQSIKRRTRNRLIKTTVSSAIKKARTLIAEGKAPEAKEAVRLAEKLMAKAASKKIVHKNNAARRISRLASRAAAIAK